MIADLHARKLTDRLGSRSRPLGAAPVAGLGLLLAALTLSTAAPCLAETAVTVCPPTLAVRQQAAPPESGAVGRDGAGSWQVSYGTKPNALSTVTFFDGPPAEMASLVYDDLAEAKSRSVATWRFLAGAASKGIWIECRYDGTTAVLARRLPDKIKTCRVVYGKDKNLPCELPILEIDCR